jgi:hypothetical protein
MHPKTTVSNRSRNIETLINAERAIRPPVVVTMDRPPMQYSEP